MTESISVLHVEDNHGFAELAAEFLQRADETITVTTEHDPGRALDRLRENPDAVDCIVSDYDMPGMDGLELLETVRREYPHIPFILFTGKGSEEIASEAISGGVTDYLQKETETEVYQILAHRIQNAVRSRWAQEDAARTRRFLEKVVERATDIIAVVDTNHEVVFTSGSSKAILGYDPAEVSEIGPFGLVHPDDRAMVEAHFEARLSDRNSSTAISIRTHHKAGHYVRTQARAYNLTDNPDVEGVLIYLHESDVGNPC